MRKKGTDPRKLHLKLRVVTTRPLPAETVRLLLERAIATGIVPPGIEIHGIDWAKGRNADSVEGSQIRRALREFYAAMVHDGTKRRFELVSAGDYVPPARVGGRRPKRKGPFRDKRGSYRDARGRFISKEQYRASRRRFTAEEEGLLDEMRSRVRTRRVGAGAEFELTATTRGGTPKQRR